MAADIYPSCLPDEGKLYVSTDMGSICNTGTNLVDRYEASVCHVDSGILEEICGRHNPYKKKGGFKRGYKRVWVNFILNIFKNIFHNVQT